MFTKYSIWKEIGKLDAEVLALTFIIMVLAIIMYYAYLHNTSDSQTKEQKRLKQATIPIYRLGFLLQ